jgi:hypothetical protein
MARPKAVPVPQRAVAVLRCTIMLWNRNEWRQATDQPFLTVYVLAPLPFRLVAERVAHQYDSRDLNDSIGEGIGVILYHAKGPQAGQMISAAQMFFDQDPT